MASMVPFFIGVVINVTNKGTTKLLRKGNWILFRKGNVFFKKSTII